MQTIFWARRDGWELRRGAAIKRSPAARTRVRGECGGEPEEAPSQHHCQSDQRGPKQPRQPKSEGEEERGRGGRRAEEGREERSGERGEEGAGGGRRGEGGRRRGEERAGEGEKRGGAERGRGGAGRDEPPAPNWSGSILLPHSQGFRFPPVRRVRGSEAEPRPLPPPCGPQTRSPTQTASLPAAPSPTRPFPGSAPSCRRAPSSARSKAASCWRRR